VKATVPDGREAMWNFINVLTTMHSGDAGSAVMEFAECLNQALDANRNTEKAREHTIRVLAEKAAYLVGMEVVDDPVSIMQETYDETEMDWQALRWYAMGHSDGEEGMELHAQGHKEWGDW